MNRILSPIQNKRGRLCKLKRGLKPIKLRNEINLPTLKVLGNTLNTNIKIPKVKNMKLVSVKSPKMSTKVKRSWFSASRTYKVKQNSRKLESQDQHNNSTADNSLLLDSDEWNRWTSIHYTMIHSMKQKVQNARESRFKGFFSPLCLRQKINDVRERKARNITSLSIERDEQVLNPYNTHFSSVKMNSPTLTRKFKYTNLGIPESLLKDVLEL